VVNVVRGDREIGIRVALGARVSEVARRVTIEVFSMVLARAISGVGLGVASVRYLETLFYEVKATDPSMLAIPLLLMFALALLAALPPVIHAARIDPVRVLRAD
jgi:ABC-type antimicrobial peptide transport system permease subunit